MKEVHILLIEDNEGDIVLTLDAFDECKIKTRISVARNGKEAMDFLFVKAAEPSENRPDLVLLDINIPVYSGHEVLQAIKTDPSLKKIPVIMLTTSSNQRDIDLAYENHANSYITKPIEMDRFLGAILKIEQFWLQLSKLPD
jgi:CheY-like chemotaxis protein